METPFALVRLVSKALLNAVGGGVLGDVLVEALPDVARDVWEWWARDTPPEQQREQLHRLAVAPFPVVRDEARRVVAELAPQLPEQEQARFAALVAQVPAAVRRTLRRPADPGGTTVPATFTLRGPKDVLALLPDRLPRFQPGDTPLPGVDLELIELLGTGGFGEVWKARNPHLPSSQPVALKFCLDTAAAKVLQNEAALLDRVMHQMRPGVVALRNTFLRASPPCLEYELVSGGDLAGLVAEQVRIRGGLKPANAHQLIAYLARIVGGMHRLIPPIVHRDLKPANILVQQTPDGKVALRVADFGIGGVAAGQALAQSRPGHSSGLQATAVRGACTPLYASPEQIRGDPPRPTDDVHALGVMWYQLLLGDLTAGRPGGVQWRRKLAERGVAAEHLDLLQACWEDAPEDRPTDAQELAERIDAVKPPPVLTLLPPDAVEVEAGGGHALTVRVKRERYDGPATVRAEGLPAGLTAAPADLAAGASDTQLSLTAAADAAACQVTARLVAEGDGVRAGADWAVTVRRPPEPEIRLPRLEPAAVEAGAACPVLVTVERFHYAGAVTITAEGLPPGVSCPPVTLAPGQDAGELTVAAAQDAPATADHALTVVAAGEGVQASTPLALTVIAVAPVDTSGGKKDDFQKGLDHLARKRPARAVEAFTAAIVKKPDHADAYRQRALAQIATDTGKKNKRIYEAALKDFQKAYQLQPSAEVLTDRAEVHLRYGDPTRALADADAALALAPDLAWAHDLRGQALERLDRPEDALAAFDAALQRDEATASTHASKGRLLHKLGRLDEALACLTRAVQLAPQDDYAYYRGLVHQARGDQDAAVADCATVIGLWPKWGDPFLARARSYLALGQPKRAVADLTKALKDYMIFHQHGPAYALRGEAYLALADYRAAIDDFSAALKENGAKDPQLFYLRGLARLRFGHAGFAAKDLTYALDLAPNHAAARAARAAAHHAKGDLERAEADYGLALEQDPNQAETWLGRARVRLDRSEPAAAVADCDAAIRLTPSLAEAYYLRGRAQVALQELDRAIADFTVAIQFDTRHAAAHYHRGRCYEAKGDTARGSADLKKALKLDPDVEKTA